MTEPLFLAVCRGAVTPGIKWFLGAVIWSMAVFGIAGITLGGLSLLSPRRSILLYVRMMKRFNWRVSPIDEDREIRNTRRMGFFLTLGSAVLMILLFYRLLPWAFAEVR